MKIGVFSGTFDPVHAGHITFALTAAEQADLDKVYFLPEQVPRRKSGVTHYAHRVAMLKLALKPHQKLEILELPDKQFSMKNTLPRLNKKFETDELFMLIGTDMLRMLSSDEVATQWPGHKQLVDNFSLVVGVRSETEVAEASRMLDVLQNNGVVVETDRQHVSSRSIRGALMNGESHDELLKSLETYVRQNWLYVSPAVNNS